MFKNPTVIICLLMVVHSCQGTIIIPEVETGYDKSASYVPELVSGSIRSHQDSAEPVPCRHSFDMSRCVDEAIDPNNATLWCPFRMCGSSYVETDECATEDDMKPQGKCVVKVYTAITWICEVHGKKESWELPQGCSESGTECKPTDVCVCKQEKNERHFLTKTDEFMKPSKPCPVTATSG